MVPVRCDWDSGAGESSDDACEAMDSSERFRFRTEPVDIADKGESTVLFSADDAFRAGETTTEMLFTVLPSTLFPFPDERISAGVSSTYSGRLPGDSSTNPGRLETSSIAASVSGGEGGDSWRIFDPGGCTRVRASDLEG